MSAFVLDNYDFTQAELVAPNRCAQPLMHRGTAEPSVALVPTCETAKDQQIHAGNARPHAADTSRAVAFVVHTEAARGVVAASKGKYGSRRRRSERIPGTPRAATVLAEPRYFFHQKKEIKKMKITYRELVAANRAAEDNNQRRLAKLDKTLTRMERVSAILLGAVALGCVIELGRVAFAAVKFGGWL